MFVDLWDLISPFLVWISGLLFLRKTFSLITTQSIPSLRLYIYHTLYSLFYFLYSLSNSADSFGYYQAGVGGIYTFFPGTPFVESICSLLYSVFHLSYLSTFLFFNIIGTLALFIFYLLIISISIHSSSLFRKYSFLLIYFPSVSFWSAAIGKDVFSFLSINLAIWSLLSFQTRKGLALISFLLMFFVRPHMAFILLFAFALSILFFRPISLYKRLFILSLISLFSIFAFGYSIRYVGLSGIDSLSFLSDYVS